MNANIYCLFEARSPGSDRIFIETPLGRTITYGEAFAAAGRLAGVLSAHGVAPGERVAVQVEKSAEAVLLALACFRCGAALLPLNTAYTPAEIEYFIADASPRVIVCAPQKQATMAELARRHGVAAVETLGADGEGSLMDRAAGESCDFPTVERGSDDLAAILYTSGTTGRSKGAMTSRGNLSSNAETLRDAWRMTSADVLLHALPLFHTHGLFVAINTLLVAGGRVLLLPKFDVDEVFRLMPRATVMFQGYWRMPEKTASEFSADGYFKTGDLGRIDARGYVYIVGRAKDLVISGGYNVYPKEVEAEIDALNGVVESAVFGVPHPDLGEGVTAAVVLKEGVMLDEATVLAALKQQLANYKLPKRVLFLEAMPRNTMGKVLKGELRETYANLFA